MICVGAERRPGAGTKEEKEAATDVEVRTGAQEDELEAERTAGGSGEPEAGREGGGCQEEQEVLLHRNGRIRGKGSEVCDGDFR